MHRPLFMIKFVCAGLFVSGCGVSTAPQLLEPVKGDGLASQYQSAPYREGNGALYFDGGVLYVNTSRKLFELGLSSLEPGALQSAAVRLDAPINPYSSLGWLVPNPDNGFAISSLGEGDQPAVRFITGGAFLQDFWLAYDYSVSQFSQKGDQWVAASYGYYRVSRDLKRGTPEKIIQLGPYFRGGIELVSGASGKLGFYQQVSEQGLPAYAPKWFDPISGLDYDLSLFPNVEDTSGLWVDQGHLFYESETGIRDLGRMITLDPVRASEDASALSPWSVTRSTDKLVLTVESIYKNGPKYVLKRPGKIWTQESSLYGLHALWDDGEIYDLRTGKLAVTIRFGDDDSGDFLITTSIGPVAGTPAMIQKSNLSSRYNPDKVLEILKDLLVLRKGQFDETLEEGL